MRSLGQDGRYEAMKPLLFLDVDGVLNYHRPPCREYLVEVRCEEMAVNAFTARFEKETVEFKVYIPSAYPGWLAELSEHFELVWATTWEDLANKHLSGLLGLGQLRVVNFAQPTFSQVKNHDVAMWKWRSIVEFAGETPFCFVDDQAQSLARVMPVSKSALQGVICTPNGLLRKHVDQLLEFAAGL